MTRRRFRLLGAAAGLLLVAAPALAQTTLDDPLDARDAKRVDRMEKVVRELRAIVFQSRDTGKPVVVEPADTDARMQEQASKITDLEQSLTKLNGALEFTTHELDQARRDRGQLEAQMKVLADRLTADEQKLAETAVAAIQPPLASSPAPANPQASAADAFTKARQQMLSGDYGGAEAAFGAYVTTYPDSPKTPEARYWWGKTLAVRGDAARSAGAFIGAIRGWPQTVWAPDALVELAKSLVALKKPTDACQTLAELPKRYPKAAVAIKDKAAATRMQAKCAA